MMAICSEQPVMMLCVLIAFFLFVCVPPVVLCGYESVFEKNWLVVPRVLCTLRVVYQHCKHC